MIKTLAALAAAAVAMLAPLTASPSASAAPVLATGSVAIERALLSEMNAARARHGRAPLRADAQLTRPARAHSGYLLRTGRFTHDGPGGAPFFKRLYAAGSAPSRSMSENIAQASGCGVGIARQTVGMWMASPGHRANLLNPRYRFVGSGVAAAAGCSFSLVTADYGS